MRSGSPVVAAFGGGVDSTAMLIGMVERSEPVDLILFADTGGEKPHTYQHLEAFSTWLVKRSYPEIRTVYRINRAGEYRPLEQDCLDGKMLPSIAYGYKACSMKYKRDPQDKFVNNWPEAKESWKRGEKVVKLIGYDAGESHRAAIPEDEKYVYRYPLIEWNWGRDEAEEVCLKALGYVPGKSACFFCPSSKKHEILDLKKRYPDLLARALAMEANAELTAVKGLGRDFAWRDLIGFAERQLDMFPETPIQEECGCYDG